MAKSSTVLHVLKKEISGHWRPFSVQGLSTVRSLTKLKYNVLSAGNFPRHIQSVSSFKCVGMDIILFSLLCSSAVVGEVPSGRGEKWGEYASHDNFRPNCCGDDNFRLSPSCDTMDRLRSTAMSSDFRLSVIISGVIALIWSMSVLQSNVMLSLWDRALLPTRRRAFGVSAEGFRSPPRLKSASSSSIWNKVWCYKTE